ncbi:unnamed protein product [Dibothriocephalus latus]|uniref:PH domain-containing protein n=1 Tax=Dibothriocephalus latus TaxID=60516 RepID=A0A3P6SFJ7_DIBLA|nr:unnamed protein product [Dibothriocephalus latus]
MQIHKFMSDTEDLLEWIAAKSPQARSRNIGIALLGKLSGKTADEEAQKASSLEKARSQQEKLRHEISAMQKQMDKLDREQTRLNQEYPSRAEEVRTRWQAVQTAWDALRQSAYELTEKVPSAKIVINQNSQKLATAWTQTQSVWTTRNALYEKNVELRKLLSEMNEIESWLEEQEARLKNLNLASEQPGFNVDKAMKEQDDIERAVEDARQRVEAIKRKCAVENVSFELLKFAAARAEGAEGKANSGIISDARVAEIRRRESSKIIQSRPKYANQVKEAPSSTVKNIFGSLLADADGGPGNSSPQRPGAEGLIKPNIRPSADEAQTRQTNTPGVAPPTPSVSNQSANARVPIIAASSISSPANMSRQSSLDVDTNSTGHSGARNDVKCTGILSRKVTSNPKKSINIFKKLIATEEPGQQAVLSGATLFFYDNLTDSSHSAPTARYDVRGGRFDKSPATQKAGKSRRYELKATLADKTEMTLGAQTEEELDKWLRCLNESAVLCFLKISEELETRMNAR